MESIGSSFDRVLDKALASASSDVSDQDRLLDRTLELVWLLRDSTKRCFRKRASSSLPKSLLSTMFNKCAMDRLCYSHIDLTTAAKDAANGVLCTMIHRAGKELRD
ncbi:unnamed protein product [Arabis nemorensis]|uniref:Uncharacterized protein n=1 Tax=Arabis nemorensis TaxID=586526 RepID=A0A565BT17_9BRAS|nr:unnamed protein product [Arabis nemorensis]